MKKVIHTIVVYGPIILSGIVALFLLPLLFSWSFVPYNGYVWCGTSTALLLLVSICAKIDYTRQTLPKIEENGILLLATLNTVWWIYVWSVVEYTIILPFGVLCIAFTLHNALKLCDETVKRTLGLMAGAMASIVGIIIIFVPLLSPLPIIRENFSVYNEQGYVAKVKVIRDAGNVYNISVNAKKTGGNLGLGRFESTDKVSAFYEVVNVADYQKPEVTWQGEDLYVNGEQQPVYWE
jgi:hypothetical protein